MVIFSSSGVLHIIERINIIIQLTLDFILHSFSQLSCSPSCKIILISLVIVKVCCKFKFFLRLRILNLSAVLSFRDQIVILLLDLIKISNFFTGFRVNAQSLMIFIEPLNLWKFLHMMLFLIIIRRIESLEDF